MRARLSIAFVACLAAALLLAPGCGNERGRSPDLDQLGGRSVQLRLFNPGAVRFLHPRSWTALRTAPPMYAQLASGGALAAVYAYPRRDLGTDRASLRASRRRLVESLRRRDPGFLITGTRITEVDGSPAVEIRGRGAIAGEAVRTRTVHVYKPAVEWVIDAYARPSQFVQANRIAFAPMLASIRLSDRPPEQPGADREAG